MQVQDFLDLYLQNSWVQTLSEKIQPGRRIQIKGLCGSADAVLAASIWQLQGAASAHLFVLHDREEALGFFSDLHALLKERASVLFYPALGKDAVQFSRTLLRAEALCRLCDAAALPPLVVSWPDALADQLPSPEAVTQALQCVKPKDTLHLTSWIETLTAQGFEETDCVCEPGQFAIRGGIVDVFSYAYRRPLRLQLRGQIIEDIRRFDPVTQRSLHVVDSAYVLPNLLQHASAEGVSSLGDFLSPNSLVWTKDDALLAQLRQDNSLFLRGPVIEFGKRFSTNNAETVDYKTHPLPALQKEFTLWAQHIQEVHHKHQVVLATKSLDHHQQITTLLAQAHPSPAVLDPMVLNLREGFVDDQMQLACYTDHQLLGQRYRGKTVEHYARAQTLTLRALQKWQVGDYVVHADYGVGQFAGLGSVHLDGRTQEVVRIVYKNNDCVSVGVQSLYKLSKYKGQDGAPPTVSKLGSSEWTQKKQRVKRQVKEVAKELLTLYAKRKKTPGFSFAKDTVLEAELTATFPYEETADQVAAISAVYQDMESPHPMDRLVCGDVGFGKTEVAMRAALKAVRNGKQVALLTPTTVLALQHHRSFVKRLASFEVRIACVSRLQTARTLRKILEQTARGEIDILIGTHRILNPDVQFAALGLLIVDEEQKFGVKAKDRLKAHRVNLDVLALTATPIPRTLHFSLMGSRDLSLIATPPLNRQPIATRIHIFDPDLISRAIVRELERGGQTFFVHNQVSTIGHMAEQIQRLVPDARVTVAHGQMSPQALEQRMAEFVSGQHDVLVATTIVESGLDLPNANTIIIHQSHRFGLSDLHQLRGRVGRSEVQAFCYLLAPPVSVMTPEARRRLSALEEFSELGDGFRIAMRDLDLRGAGNLLGAQQSGFIADLGFETYCKLLEEAVRELKSEDFRDLFPQELSSLRNAPDKTAAIDTDIETCIPCAYIPNESDRLHVYSRLSRVQSEEKIRVLYQELEDRFGPMPPPAKHLFEVTRLRWEAQQLSIQHVKLWQDMLCCTFTTLPNCWDRILSFVQSAHTAACRIKETDRGFVVCVSGVRSLQQALGLLRSWQS